ncbi:hypothetical protein [Novosphingobium sp. B1]|uniref:hypothetical protein n=1 Tax=Novosphingobium sp. B1 TaxID=1938756 RepID=UPI0009D85A56|nr:hypothetical protein [Novosphingobium sp. B1]SMC57954.1 hypothetical protein SAMN06272759_104252 [Novosphingobium sp. B1]
MFDLAALPLPPAGPATAAAPLHNGGNPADAGDQAISGTIAAPGIAFEALLALQTAPAEPADAPLPESGKTLPDAAKLVAALPQSRPADLPTKPSPAKTKAETQTDGSKQDGHDDVEPEAVALPDPSLIAAIFAAPDRLASTPAQTAPAASVTAPQLQSVASQPQAEALAAAHPQASRSAVNIALASSAQIDLETQPEAHASAPQQVTPALPATAQLVAARQARQMAPARGSDSEQPVAANAPVTPLRASFTPDQESAEVVPVEAPTAVAVPLERPTPAHETAAPAAIRNEARPERVDFATLVDTLARAREDAAPRTVSVSVSHTEFGRVSLRFEADEDRGMTVAMSSADPGFARAVSATSEARNSGETSAQAQQQHTSPDARAQTGQGESQRHQPQPAERAPSRASANPSAQNRDERRAPDGERGIYA